MANGSPDLSANIKFASGGSPIEISDSMMAGNYMGANVSASSIPGGDNEGIASVTW